MGTDKAVLFVGHYREPRNSGWGKLALQEMQLLKDYCDLRARPMLVRREKSDIPDWLKDLESKPLTGIETAIHYVLPHCFERLPGIKNILWVELETNDIRFSTWTEYMNTADEIWVTNECAKKTLEESNSILSFIPIKVMPHRVTTTEPSDEFYDIAEFGGCFNFYTIGTPTHRKNYEDLLSAFHTEFDPSESVNMIIKTTKDLDDLYRMVKENLKMYEDVHEYKKEVTISADLDDSKIAALHHKMDCFITTSHGEGWCIPAWEAAAYGNPVIAPFYGGTKKLMEKFHEKQRITNFVSGTCYDGGSIPNYQNARDTWNCPDQNQIRTAMRFVFDNRNKFKPVDLSDFNDENHVTTLLENC
jgi:glycosyltransferase involved in cell wall biosynthesis